MKVLQVINSLEPYGAEMLLRDLVLGFAPAGISCDIYLLQSTGSDLERSLRSAGVRIFASPKASIYSISHIRFLARHLRSTNYDLVHAHLFPTQLWAALAVEVARMKSPLIITEHNTYNRRRRHIYRPLDRWMYARYRSIACINDATCEALIKWLPEVAGRVRTCNNGIHLETFAGTCKESKVDVFSLPESCLVVLSVGRLEWQKNHETVIRALSAVHKAHLFIVGAGPMLKELQTCATQSGVADRVHFLGRRNDVPRLLRAADIFVQSSRWEGFGIAAVEAMASGLPVVASRVPGLADVIGSAGELFTPGDHRELASLLNAIARDQALWTRLAEAGKRRATEFRFEKTLQCYQVLYQDVLSGAFEPAE